MALTKVTRNLLSTGIDDQSTSTAITIDSSSNVGLGVTPSASAFTTMQIKNASLSGWSGDNSAMFLLSNAYFDGTNFKYISSTYAHQYRQQAGSHSWYTAASGTSGNTIAFTQAMTLDNSGNVGINITTPSDTLQVNGGITFGADTVTANRSRIYESSGLNIFGGESNNRPVIIHTNNAERMRIDSSGNVLVGTTAQLSFGSGTTTGVVLEPKALVASRDNESPLYLQRSGSDGGIAFFYKGTSSVGSISVNTSATSYNTSSDARLKDVTGSARGLEVINALNPVSFNWKADGRADEGLLAQEVLEIVPNAVTGSEEEYYQMDYSKLVTHLIAGMKEQQVLIEQLQARLEILENA